MGDAVSTQRLVYQCLFAAVAALLIFVQILPFRIGARNVPGPDLIVLLCFAWVLRRPDYVPMLLVAAVVFAADLLLLRPPGLWAALTVLGLEFLRSREQFSRDLPFLLEWAMVAGVLAAMTLARSLLMAIAFLDQPPIMLYVMQMTVSILSYPIAVLVSRHVLGVGKVAPGEVDALGHRL
ncbi:rod shape-determining protein MreD [Tranquillimonas rosea]|uniref:Rod shape-determining protein MreD n=1 Tax=Tranquillimonas rosea TaxID=641238 RepID=A0A1H9TTX9_9RHOB|nr:hypothetical protein [Tranquillimonas rosea]SES00830.1 rod shape-determining protein MreD [Tranquillimonas rosea]